MNSGIMVLQDGTPCIFYDEPLPPIKYVEFSRADFQVTLVWENAETKAEEKLKLEYPLSQEFAKLLEHFKLLAIGMVQEGQKDLDNLNIVPIKIMDAA